MHALYKQFVPTKSYLHWCKVGRPGSSASGFSPPWGDHTHQWDRSTPHPVPLTVHRSRPVQVKSRAQTIARCSPGVGDACPFHEFAEVIVNAVPTPRGTRVDCSLPRGEFTHAHTLVAPAQGMSHGYEWLQPVPERVGGGGDVCVCMLVFVLMCVCWCLCLCVYVGVCACVCGCTHSAM